MIVDSISFLLQLSQGQEQTWIPLYDYKDYINFIMSKAAVRPSPITPVTLCIIQDSTFTT